MMNSWKSGTKPGLQNLIFDQQPIPDLIPGHVLVNIDSAALNYSDLLMINDKYQVKPPRPFTPGQEISGTINAVNPGSHLKIGQRIASKVFWGGFAQFALVREDMAIKLPEHINFATGAALPVVYITAMVALDGLVSPEITVLVHAAAGGVGLRGRGRGRERERERERERGGRCDVRRMRRGEGRGEVCAGER